MSGDFLADTNIVSAILDRDPKIADRPRSDRNLCISIIIAGEMYYGARNSTRVLENTRRIESFIQSVIVYDVDLATAEYFGRIKTQLRTSGTKIPDHDIGIAATAIQHDLTVVTRDEHFSFVDGLAVEKW